MKFLTLFLALVSVAFAQLPSTFKPAKEGSIDPRTIPGMVVGYNVANTTRTGGLVDSWLDISGNGRTATPVGAKSTIAGSGADEFAYLGEPYTVAGGIPITSSGMTVVVIYGGGRIPYTYRGEFSTILTADGDAGIGGLTNWGDFKFFNPEQHAGVIFEGTRNCLVHRFGAAQRANISNGIRWDVSANAAYSTPVAKIWGGFTGAFAWQFERVAVYIYNRTLSDTELSGINAYHNVPTVTAALYPVADSFGVGYTATTTAQGYSRLVEAATGRTIVGLATKQAIVTADIDHAAIATAIAALHAKGLDPVILFDAGKNDAAFDVPVATLQASYTTKIGAWTAAGGKVIATTLPPRNNGFSGGVNASVYESRRQTFNTWLRTQSALWTRLADVGGDPRIGDVADLSGPNYSDGIHPTAAGHAIYAELIVAAINSLD